MNILCMYFISYSESSPTWCMPKLDPFYRFFFPKVTKMLVSGILELVHMVLPGSWPQLMAELFPAGAVRLSVSRWYVQKRRAAGAGGIALPNSNILTGKQQPKGSQNWHLGPQVVVCHPNTFRHSVLDVDLGFCPRFCVKPWTRKSVSAIAKTLSTVKIMLKQWQRSLESDVQGWDTLQRTLHIHHGAPSSDLPMGPLPGSYMWNPMQPLNAGSRGSRKGTLLLSPQTTGPPCQACFPGWVSANIPSLSCRTLRELCEFSGSCNGLISFLKNAFFPPHAFVPCSISCFQKV